MIMMTNECYYVLPSQTHTAYQLLLLFSIVHMMMWCHAIMQRMMYIHPPTHLSAYEFFIEDAVLFLIRSSLHLLTEPWCLFVCMLAFINFLRLNQLKRLWSNPNQSIDNDDDANYIDGHINIHHYDDADHSVAVSFWTLMRVTIIIMRGCSCVL